MFIVRIVPKELKYQKMEVSISVHSALLKTEKRIDEITINIHFLLFYFLRFIFNL